MAYPGKGACGMFRQKIMERDEFTWDERKDIAGKSVDRCCHCGRKVFFGYGATVDHFVPLHRGGTNRDVNMVMLCEECNREKADKILLPEQYLKHLAPAHLERLEGYFESYIQSFEYLERTNLLSCDEYEVEVVPLQAYRSTRKKNRRKVPGVVHRLRRERPDDFGMLHGYFVRYLEKHRFLRGEEEAATDLEFWMRFGCIYFIEKAGEVKCMAAATIKDVSGVEDWVEEGFSNVLSMYIFPYYSTAAAATVARGIALSLPGYIVKEQGLPCIPVEYAMVSTDGCLPYVLDVDAGTVARYKDDPTLLSGYGGVLGPKGQDEMTEEDWGAVSSFFAKFKDVGGGVAEFIGKRGSDAAPHLKRDIVA